MDNDQTPSLVIRRHDFQEAKNSLKKYSEKAKKDVELSRVPCNGGWFNLGKHKVTGSEFNNVTSQIQDYMISGFNSYQGLVDEFEQVYKAFEYLDKDYISGIVASIKAAEEVSRQEQKDRKDIKKLVYQHEQSVAVLKKFKADIDRLSHLTDIDKAWDLIQKQTKLSKELSDYIAELSNELKAVGEYCDELSNIQHIKDIDELWDTAESLGKDIQNIEAFSFEQGKKLASIDSAVQEQISAINKIEKAQEEKLEVLLSSQSSALEQIANDQSDRLEEIHKSLEKEKASLSEQVNILTQKVKLSYIIAGGASALAVIQLILNILGVI